MDINRELYKLVEGTEECTGCELSDVCDKVADELNLIEYMLCAEEEDFDKFEFPIYKRKNYDED